MQNDKTLEIAITIIITSFAITMALAGFWLATLTK